MGLGFGVQGLESPKRDPQGYMRLQGVRVRIDRSFGETFA